MNKKQYIHSENKYRPVLYLQTLHIINTEILEIFFVQISDEFLFQFFQTPETNTKGCTLLLSYDSSVQNVTYIRYCSEFLNWFISNEGA